MSTSSARHIFEVLRLIGSESAPLGATDVRRRLGLALTTAHRALNTLEQEGYVSRHQSSTKYGLGPTSRALLQSFLSRFPLRSVALPYMQRLTVISGDTTSLFVPIGWYAVRIASVKGTNEVIHTGPIGETMEMGRKASGHVLLRSFPPDRRQRYWASPQGKDAEPDHAISSPHGQDTGGPLFGWSEATGQGQIAFSITDADGAALGAVAIEGGSQLAEAAQDSRIEAYTQVVEQLVHAVRTGNRTVTDPYGHLDPDTIELPSTR